MSRDRQAADASAIRSSFLNTIGVVPPLVETMIRMDSNWASKYAEYRRYLYEERPAGLSLPMKELIFLLLDVVSANVDGAKRHLTAAVAAGLTRQQLADGLQLVYLVHGIQPWGLAGTEVWEHWEQLASSGHGPEPAHFESES